MTVPPTPQPPYPLHPSVVDKLDPVYVEFYNKHILNAQQVHYQPISVSRSSGTLIPGGGPPMKVASIEDYEIKRTESEGPDVTVRTFTPLGEPPKSGWPVMIYFHGGGWVLGNINTENTVCSHMAARAKCVVISVDYRLAPESPWPAAVHDSWEALLWTLSQGLSLLNLDTTKVAVGGSSAGGNLAAIVSHLASTRNLRKLSAQLLVVPVTDNTASPSTNRTYKSAEFTAALPAVKMLWYRQHYLPNEADWSNPEASPLLYPDGPNWAKQPRALVVLGELDVLRAEGEDYAEKLRSAGVQVEVKVMKGMPHPFLAMDGVLQQGKDAITAMCETLQSAFGT